MSSKFGCRPSDLYGVHDEVAALYFDRAVFTFGTSVEADIQNAAETAKNDKQARASAMRVLHKWLDQDKTMKGRYRDPGAR